MNTSYKSTWIFMLKSTLILFSKCLKSIMFHRKLYERSNITIKYKMKTSIYLSIYYFFSSITLSWSLSINKLLSSYMSDKIINAESVDFSSIYDICISILTSNTKLSKLQYYLSYISYQKDWMNVRKETEREIFVEKMSLIDMLNWIFNINVSSKHVQQQWSTQ